MRLLAILIMFTAGSFASASSYYHCVAPLKNAADPDALAHPEVSFRLSFGDNDPPLPFVGQGFAFDGQGFAHMKWQGIWTNFNGNLQLIGAYWDESEPVEWRGHAVFSDDQVMILNVDRGDGGEPMMIRCLPTEGA